MLHHVFVILAVICGSLMLSHHSSADISKTNPNRAGFDPKRLDSAKNVLSQAMHQPAISGAHLLVWRKGQVALNEVLGFSDIASTSELTSSAQYRLLSLSSLFTSIAIMQLVETGQLLLSDPIAKYIPELGNVALRRGPKALNEAPIQIYHLLLQTAGFSSSFQNDPVGLKYYRAGMMPGHLYKDQVWADLAQNDLLKILADLPLASKPGHEYRQSISYDLLGIIIQRVSGQSIDEYFDANIFQPLEMNDSMFVADKQKQLTTLYGRDKIRGLVPLDPASISRWNGKRNFLSGSSGLLSSMSDLLKLCKLLISNPRNKTLRFGNSVISKLSIQRIIKPHFKTRQLNDLAAKLLQNISSQREHEIGITFGGYSIDGETNISPISAKSFIAFSQTGSFILLDPHEELVIVFLTQTLLENANSPIIELQERIVETVYQAILKLPH